MRILIFAHHLELGGSQVNATELAAAVRDLHGHEVVFFAAPGAGLALVHRQHLRFIEAPHTTRHPSVVMARALARAVREVRPDLIHAWEWPQCLDAFYGVHLPTGLPLAASDMSMTVIGFLPRRIPMTYGTPALVAQARRLRTGPVLLLEPPVDTIWNRPGAVDVDHFRAAHGLDAHHLNLVVVSRLVSWMKLEGIERAIAATELLARELPVRLVVVGGGTAEARLRAVADQVNQRLGRPAIVMTGALADPRPAYASADVVLGMGSSILRGMAFAKPCLVLGERGFCATFTPETSGYFLHHGFYGVGGGPPSGSDVEAQLRGLLTNARRRHMLGAFGRRLVDERFSLPAAASTLDSLYRLALEAPDSRPRALLDGAVSALHRVAGQTLPPAIKQTLRPQAPLAAAVDPVPTPR